MEFMGLDLLKISKLKDMRERSLTLQSYIKLWINYALIV